LRGCGHTPNLNQIFFGPTYPSPDSMFFTQFHSDAAGTWASMEWLQDPEVDALIDAARATGDVAEQAEALQGAAGDPGRQDGAVPLAGADGAACDGQLPARLCGRADAVLRL
jgi:ABC-type transport system substrate-binding protein